MSLSDCEKCWETPCICGYEYETWETKRITELRDVLNKLLECRAAGEPVRNPFAKRRAYTIEELTSQVTFTSTNTFERKR